MKPMALSMLSYSTIARYPPNPASPRNPDNSLTTLELIEVALGIDCRGDSPFVCGCG